MVSRARGNRQGKKYDHSACHSSPLHSSLPFLSPPGPRHDPVGCPRPPDNLLGLASFGGQAPPPPLNAASPDPRTCRRLKLPCLAGEESCSRQVVLCGCRLLSSKDHPARRSRRENASRGVANEAVRDPTGVRGLWRSLMAPLPLSCGRAGSAPKAPAALLRHSLELSALIPSGTGNVAFFCRSTPNRPRLGWPTP